MGMFDRFLVHEVCPSCGKEVTEVQSKALGCYLDSFKIGDIVQEEGDINLTAVTVIENLCCDNEVKLYIMNNKYVYYEVIK